MSDGEKKTRSVLLSEMWPDSGREYLRRGDRENDRQKGERGYLKKETCSGEQLKQKKQRVWEIGQKKETEVFTGQNKDEEKMNKEKNGRLIVRNCFGVAYPSGKGRWEKVVWRSKRKGGTNFRRISGRGECQEKKKNQKR